MGMNATHTATRNTRGKTMSAIYTNASQAIDDSVRTGSAIHVDESDCDMHADLLSECDESVETRTADGEPVTEYWGEQDGQTWRVHVYGHYAI